MLSKLPFVKKRAKDKKDHHKELDNIPKHVAIIMDGNGRWAKKRRLPRVAGHKEGMNTVKNTVRSANKHQLEVLTLYAFSTENWKRPKNEVDYLMKLPIEFLNTFLPELIEKNVRVQTIGDVESLPSQTIKAVQTAKEKTKNNDGLILNFALNYGSRFEIIQAVKQIIKDTESNELDFDAIDDDLLSNYLYTNQIKDPDLLIRTSGEQRLSNFLLWQSAYTEFWFTDVLWPDFDENIFEKALSDYEKRKRRYGGI